MSLSLLRSTSEAWQTHQDFRQDCPWLTEAKFTEITNVLLENPNLNSTHLFRADILHDSAKILKTISEKENQCKYPAENDDGVQSKGYQEADGRSKAPRLEGAILVRQVHRRLVPRNPRLDRPLEQWCFVYELSKKTTCADAAGGRVVIYAPDVDSETDVPWYHPTVKSLAYVFEQATDTTATLSVHYLPFTTQSVDQSSTGRLHRTMISLLKTFLRLSKNNSNRKPQSPEPKHNGDGHQNSSHVTTAASLSTAPSAIKDTILPQHIVQNTYSRLKQQYAPDLMSRWVEKTEPSKHVFEDLSIAAFVIELWKQMYSPGTFPGFVDVACGNGVLTYVLIKEGYNGHGFDARRRRTWDALEMNQHLHEMICVPKPFLDAVTQGVIIDDLLPNANLQDGIFKPGTFIISNHADELTPWTPILAALSSPKNPLPFLAIPCCSHALSGAKHRYLPKDINRTHPPSSSSSSSSASANDKVEQPASGDLRALRVAKTEAATHNDDKSMYACLTRKVVALADEIGIDVELTLMRIPSTRNIGIVGNRKKATARGGSRHDLKSQMEDMSVEDNDDKENESNDSNDLVDKIQELVRRECTISGGVHEAATTWIQRAQKLQTGTGRGKLNLGRRPESQYGGD
ncbi:uncharacterized protein PV06_02769 [Exophiala oligosperma]|uniref:tRNA (uracil-O(2)-)-methyltransferase n=1 Tax=Exophiala oligosperma TaxID=215243 RepID=A0A0D2B4J6_9EURO|nr:uncharacterized protein PV06_02769 [Exophiala oligosperma]KIW47171.1 hypothetical protein PV06_02769 [Exophiala oligosperma]